MLTSFDLKHFKAFLKNSLKDIKNPQFKRAPSVYIHTLRAHKCGRFLGNHILTIRRLANSLPLNWNIPDQLQREPEAADRLVRPGVHQLSQIHKDWELVFIRIQIFYIRKKTNLRNNYINYYLHKFMFWEVFSRNFITSTFFFINFSNSDIKLFSIKYTLHNIIWLYGIFFFNYIFFAEVPDPVAFLRIDKKLYKV